MVSETRFLPTNSSPDSRIVETGDSGGLHLLHSKMEKLCPAKKGCGRYTLTVEVANFFGVVQATKWSTLSAYFPLIDGFFVGSHPDICRIVKSIFEERPTLPKYSDTRDVKTVLDHLDVMSPMESLTLNKLTLKMCMLLSLVTDQRGHALYSLSLIHI